MWQLPPSLSLDSVRPNQIAPHLAAATHQTSAVSCADCKHHACADCKSVRRGLSSFLFACLTERRIFEDMHLPGHCTHVPENRASAHQVRTDHRFLAKAREETCKTIPKRKTYAQVFTKSRALCFCTSDKTICCCFFPALVPVPGAPVPGTAHDRPKKPSQSQTATKSRRNKPEAEEPYAEKPKSQEARKEKERTSKTKSWPSRKGGSSSFRLALTQAVPSTRESRELSADHAVDGCESISHHLETMVETIDGWNLQGDQHKQGFSGGAGFRPCTGVSIGKTNVARAPAQFLRAWPWREVVKSF